MYRPAYNRDGLLKHSTACRAAFGRFDRACPRCVQLLKGAPARTSWQPRYYAKKLAESQRTFQFS